MITKAIKLAAEVHDGQTDKGGQPYIFHVLTVMRMVGERCAILPYVTDALRNDAMTVAVLHDAIEDFEGPESDKLRMIEFIGSTFGSNVMHPLMCITHKNNEPYEEYIERVALSPIATIVKICDLTHNMDPRRMPTKEIGEKEYARWDKYRKALVRLERAPVKYDEIIGGRYYQVRISGREAAIGMCVTGWPAVQAHDPEGRRKNPPRCYQFVGPRFGRQYIFCDQVERELRPEEQDEQRLKRNAYLRRKRAKNRERNLNDT